MMTTAQLEARNALSESFAQSPVVIIGNGPVGVKAAQLILKQSEYHHVVIYGDEPVPPYNRVQLSLYLSGNIDRQNLANPISSHKSPRLIEKIGCRVAQVDYKNRIIIDAEGHQQRFSKLILATGSSPLIPNIEGKEKEGVLSFRSLNDANKLIEYRQEGKKILVIGSGALGLETAVAMKSPNNQVVVGVRDKLLTKFLDAHANNILKERITASGIEIIHQDPVIEILGDKSVTSVRLQSGNELPVDAVIFCTGIKPNTALGESFGLAVNNGILVNDYMETSIEHVYAIGECAEHKGLTYGIVAPGFEHAETSVKHILGQYNSYQGSLNNLQLKIEQHRTCIYGNIETPADETYIFNNRLKGLFRKILVSNRRIVGVILIGEWDEELQVREFIENKNRIGKDRLKQFEKTGVLWRSRHQGIKSKPEDYIVCLCNSVTRGEITSAMNKGNRNLESLCEATRAGTTCGSCKPLVAEILDAPVPNLVMRNSKTILVASIFSILLIILLIFNDPIASSLSVQVSWKLEQLWFDNFWKQVSGYSLLGLCLLGGALSVRKRWKKAKNIGNLDNWRLAHSIIGIVALSVLVIHTGFRLGENLNFALMVIFLAATTTGSLVGVFMSKNHHWSDLKLREHRKWWSRIHYTLLWILPALLAFHIISVYYF